jgi:hypothetical protein
LGHYTLPRLHVVYFDAAITLAPLRIAAVLLPYSAPMILPSPPNRLSLGQRVVTRGVRCVKGQVVHELPIDQTEEQLERQRQGTREPSESLEVICQFRATPVLWKIRRSYFVTFSSLFNSKLGTLTVDHPPYLPTPANLATVQAKSFSRYPSSTHPFAMFTHGGYQRSC